MVACLRRDQSSKYAKQSEIRLKDLRSKSDDWFEEETKFFEVVRMRYISMSEQVIGSEWVETISGHAFCSISSSNAAVTLRL